MKVKTLSQYAAAPVETLNEVIDDCEEVVIARDDKDPVVILPLGEYESMKETLYLLRDPQYAQELMESIKQLESGRGQVRDLLQ
ncbi:type II toxin-antitoxin system prevent-host-death family antitoxin [Glycomyces paridis]|uniref:Antitoxin n=1 Tax=Glycomyces paridis TaxID=2126555 RepID=A0A4S8PBT4_9ACTN|nr:type II toxin-antitoxin system prevent-host-death family antitoxin [Glycomyces paridis]